MSALREWMRRMLGVFGHGRADADLQEELRLHAELARAEGRPTAGTTHAMDALRDQRALPWIDEAGRDIRYALRTFGRNPGFTATVVITLALGIGANTAIFTLIDALMLRWLPVPNPQQLVLLQMRAPDSDPAGPAGESFSYPIVRALADEHEIFDGVAGFSGFDFNAGDSGSIQSVPGAVVTGGYFQTLELTPEAGRLLDATDDEPGGPLAAVISDGYWERQYHRDPAVVGQALRLNGLPVTIVGVSPRGFTGANVGSIADVTVPVAAIPRLSPEAAPLVNPGNFWLRVLARPARRLSPEAAAARLTAAWPRIWDASSPSGSNVTKLGSAAPWPESRLQAMAHATFELAPGGTGWTTLRAMFRQPLLVLMAVVGAVLLIACANVASLLLARAATRSREFAIRLAIGASRRRVMRQLLIEGALLAFAGACAGTVLAWISGRVLVASVSTTRFAVAVDLAPNWRVLTFTGAVAMATVLLCGLAPALRASAVAPAAFIQDGGRTIGGRSRLLSSLVSLQVALSIVLLIGAGLFIRTLVNLRTLDPGFDRRGVLLVDMQARRTAVPLDLVDRVRRLPGVASASLSTHTPLSGSVWSDVAVPRGQPLPDGDTAFFVGAGDGFFETMGIDILSGRPLSDADGRGSTPVAVVNETFARRHFPGTQPIGQYLAARVRGESRELEIVGLARDTLARDLRRAAPATVYVSYRQLTGNFPTTLEVRAAGALPPLATRLRQLIQPEMPDTTVDVRLLADQVDDVMVQERLMARLSGAFGGLALALVCVGLYGLLAYTVARRTREFGLRIALGATSARVVAGVLGGAARLVLIGLAVGVPTAWAASRWVQSMLFGLESTDVPTLAGAILVLGAAAVAAACVPAARASRVDPMTALRHE